MLAAAVLNLWALGGLTLAIVLLWWWVWMADKWTECVDCRRPKVSCSCPDFSVDLAASLLCDRCPDRELCDTLGGCVACDRCGNSLAGCDCG